MCYIRFDYLIYNKCKTRKLTLNNTKNIKQFTVTFLSKTIYIKISKAVIEKGTLQSSQFNLFGEK